MIITHQSRVNEPNSSLPNSQSLLVNPIRDSAKDRSKDTHPANKHRHTIKVNHNIISHSRDIWISPPRTVINATISRSRRRVVRPGCGVGLVAGIVLGEVGCERRVLVSGLRVDVGEGKPPPDRNRVTAISWSLDALAPVGR